jgi:hypothetical protein
MRRGKGLIGRACRILGPRVGVEMTGRCPDLVIEVGGDDGSGSRRVAQDRGVASG